jgi:hypothetical protein
MQTTPPRKSDESDGREAYQHRHLSDDLSHSHGTGESMTV